MSRRGSAKPTGIQMFPFLAVLICTMGALVVLLHAFARHGQAQATKLAEAKAREQQQQEELDADFFEWRVAHLREAREKTQADLAAERLKLSHVEDHQRRLERKLDALKIAAAELERVANSSTEARERRSEELAALEAQVAEARESVNQVRMNGKFQAVNYSVVPFEGRNATNRRPIYIECRENRIILQPEGIELTPRDFVGVFGPGNPLASALRAQREYFARQAPTGQLVQEPYPLMLVRPDGIAAYYAARAALNSWGNDFGYELVGADWNLAFPERDARLAELTEQVVADARERHREYAVMSSQGARRRSRPAYHATSQGGFAKVPGSDGGPHGSGMGAWEEYREDWSGAPGGGGGPRGTRTPGRNGDWPHGTAPGSLEEYAGYGNAPAADPYAEPGAMLPEARGSRAASRYANGSGGDGTIDGQTFADMRRGAGDAFGAGSEIAGERSSNQRGEGAPGTGNGGKPGDPHAPPNDSTSAHASTPQHNGKSNLASDPSLRNPNSEGGDGGAAAGQRTLADLPTSGSNSSQPGSGGQPPSGQPPSGMMAHASQSQRKPPTSMASMRGEDWGLMGSSVGAVAAARPILVRCYPDKLVLMPESRSQRAQEVEMGPRTEQSMDELVSAVWEYMKVWGKAGRGLYWRPTLLVDVQPGAEQRFEEMRHLLAGSGLDVERRPAATAGNLPPTRTPK